MLKIVDRQDDFIIIDKPVDIGFHDDNGEDGIHTLLKKQLNVDELYPVHRLDKMTSGLLIFATNKQAAQTFQSLFENKEIEKYYLAISDKKPIKKQGLIKGDMEKSRRGMWKLTRNLSNPAISQFLSYSISNGRRLFLIKPHTGKTHQIRVALSSVGSPILGDPYYAKSLSDRGYLHAYALRFSLHKSSYKYILTPADGEEFLREPCKMQIAKLHQPWNENWPRV